MATPVIVPVSETLESLDFAAKCDSTDPDTGAECPRDAVWMVVLTDGCSPLSCDPCLRNAQADIAMISALIEFLAATCHMCNGDLPSPYIQRVEPV